MAGQVFGDDLGGVGKQTAGAAIPGIGATSDTAVADETAPIMADGEPVSPAVARVRYGAAAAQGYAGDGDPGSP